MIEHKNFKRAMAAGAALAVALLSGCATPPKPMYQWEGYQPQVYEYFKTGATQEQASELEKGLEKIKAANGAEPPGYHAHLGLLYANLGNDERMAQEFQAEKTLFPESAAYVDFLIKNAMGTKKEVQ